MQEVLNVLMQILAAIGLLAFLAMALNVLLYPFRVLWCSVQRAFSGELSKDSFNEVVRYENEDLKKAMHYFLIKTETTKTYIMCPKIETIETESTNIKLTIFFWACYTSALAYMAFVKIPFIG